MILPGREYPCNWVDPVELEMGGCQSILGSPEYVLPVTQSTSFIPVSPYTRHRSLTIYLQAVIERVERCTWRPGSTELRDTLPGRDRGSVEMHLEDKIERTQRCTWRP